jgi:hypothetical protein
MKLAPAIEEFIRYKQALGNSYTTPARALRALGRTRNRGRGNFDRGSDLGRSRHWIGENPWKRPEGSVLPTLEKDDG